MTQEQLADGSGLKQAAISKYENGTAPDVTSLLRLAVGLQQPVDALLAGVDEDYDLLCQSGDQRSVLLGGADVPASERARIRELERQAAELVELKARFGEVQDVARTLFRLTVTGDEGRTASHRKTSSRKSTGTTD